MKIQFEFKSAYANLIIGAIGIFFFLLIPILSKCESCNLNAIDNSSLAKSLDSFEIRTSGVGLFVSACPMALDLIMDLFTGLEYSSIKSRRCWIGRAAIAIITVMVGVQLALGYDYLHLPYEYVLSFRFAMGCLRITYISSFMFCLCIVNPAVFTAFQTLTFSIITVAFTVIKFFGPTSNDANVSLCNTVISYIWFVSVFVIICSWITKLWKLRKSWTVDDYTCIFYMFLLMITIASMYSNLIFIWMLGSGTLDIQDSKINNLVVPISLQTACAVFMSIIPGRIARIEAIVSKDNVIETKQAYVRYISHELRTPLNTVYMGLTLSIDQIPANATNPLEIERRLTLQEVWCACEVALDILNDLLLYDKLQLRSIG